MAVAPRSSAPRPESRSPDPRRYGNWRDYALALGSWQDRQQQMAMATQPQSVLLVNVATSGTAPRPPGLARATADGLMVYDPSLQRARLAFNSDWHTLLIDSDGSFGSYYDKTASDARFVNVAGDTMTGTLQLEGTSPTLRFHETDAVDPAGHWIITGAASGNLYIQRTDQAWATPQSYMRFTTAGAINQYSATIFSEGISFGSVAASSTTDLSKHIDLWGNTYGFNVTSNALNAVIPTAASFVVRDSAALVRGTIEAPGTAATNTYTVMTREKGDARYVDKVTSTTQVLSSELHVGPFNIAVDQSALRLGSLAVYGQANSGITAATAYFAIYRGTTPAVVFQVTRGGVISSTSGTITVISDAREKEHVTDMPGTLDKLLALRPVRYTLKGFAAEQGELPGFIAQEVAEVAPELIDEVNRTPYDPDAPEDAEQDIVLGVKWSHLVPMLVKGLQEMAARVEALEGRAA